MAREVLHAGTGLVDVYQMAREVLRASNSANTNIVVRQMIRETLRSSNLGQTGIVVRQMVRETLRSTAEANLRRRQLILPNVGPFG